MKKDDEQVENLALLALAGLGVWYFFIKPAQPVPGAPAYNGYVPANAVTATGNVTNVPAANKLIEAAQKLLNPAKAASNLPATAATKNSAMVQNEVNALFSTPALNSINTGFPQSYAPPALNNNTIFNNQPAVLQPATGPDTTYNTPPVFESIDKSDYVDFQNGNYPGANIAGCDAAMIGEY